jgi:hypothetical protein
LFCPLFERTEVESVLDFFDRKNPEDIDPACEEHAVKALMYGLTRKRAQLRLVKVRI